MSEANDLHRVLAELAELGAIELEYDQDREARYRVSEDAQQQVRVQEAASHPRPHQRPRKVAFRAIGGAA